MELTYIDEYISQSLLDFGKEVNCNRQLALLYDGLKPVYRRVIYSAIKMNLSHTVKSAKIVGEVMGNLHPHSDTAIYDVLVNLVRWGLFDGQGSFGSKMIYGDDLSASHMRYTEAKLNENWKSLLGNFIDYVPYKEGEIPGNLEPEFIPTPIPLILLFSGMGIGFGVNARYPMFTPQSLFNAFIHDDPSYLEAPFGMTLTADEAELDSLWFNGYGKLSYKYDVVQTSLESGAGTMIAGSADIFKPRLEEEFYSELASGRVYILDQSDETGTRVFVGRSPNVKAITLDDIYERCVKICEYAKVFRLTVTNGKASSIIPLKEWMSECYMNYLGVIDKYKDSNIQRITFNLKVYQYIDRVAELILNDRGIEVQDIIDKINEPDCTEEVVKAILKKSINTLRKTESSDKIEALKKELQYYEDLVPGEYTQQLIQNL